MRSASWDGRIVVWDSVTGGEILPLSGHESRVSAVSWSPKGKNRLASAGNETTVRVWNAETGEEAPTLGGHRGEVRDVAWSRDGGLAVSSGATGALCLVGPMSAAPSPLNRSVRVSRLVIA